MREYELFIKEMNLIFTGTSNRREIYSNELIENTDVIYDNTISLYNLFKSYNELYMSFKNEYEKLNKINCSTNIQYVYFGKYNIKGKENRTLVFEILDNDEWKYINLSQNGDHFKSNITNGVFPRTKDDVILNIMNEEDVKKYLDLFEKYQMLFELQEQFNSEKLTGDGCSMIDVSISGNLLNNNCYVDVFMGDFYMNTSYSINLLINLGENFGIDKDKCKIILDNKEVVNTDKALNKAFNGVYVNKKYLSKS